MGVAMYKSDDIIKYLVGKYGAAILMITMPLFTEQFFDEKFINTRRVAKIKERSNCIITLWDLALLQTDPLGF